MGIRTLLVIGMVTGGAFGCKSNERREVEIDERPAAAEEAEPVVQLRQRAGTESAWAVEQVPGTEPGQVGRYVVEHARVLRQISSAGTGWFGGEGALELVMARQSPGNPPPLRPAGASLGQDGASPTDAPQVGYGEHSRLSGEASQERQHQGQTGTYDPDSQAGPQPDFAYSWAPTAGGQLTMRLADARTVTIEPIRPASSPAGGYGVARQATDAQLAREPAAEDTGAYSGYFVANVLLDGQTVDRERLVYLSTLPGEVEGEHTLHVYVLPMAVQGPEVALQPLQSIAQLPVEQATPARLRAGDEAVPGYENRDLRPPKTIEPGGPEIVDQSGQRIPTGPITQPQGQPPAEGWHQVLHLVFPGVEPTERAGT